MMRAVVFTDGACRNHGDHRAGYGVTMCLETGAVHEAYGCVGMSAETSNIAEYHALLVALDVAAEYGVTDLQVMADSMLVVMQASGRWKIRHPNMRRMHALVKESAKRIGRVTYKWIPREENRRADELSKMGMGTIEARINLRG